MNDRKTDNCYCGSQVSFNQCCEPLLNGTKKAITAEQLMRSRYSAFCCANIDYLIDSHHVSKHQPNDRETLSSTIDQCQWLALRVNSTQKGLSTDSTGEVEFTATYLLNGKPTQLREKSQFVKEEDRWFYLEGDVFADTDSNKIGRNDPCWCNSGKKFKKCHG